MWWDAVDRWRLLRDFVFLKDCVIVWYKGVDQIGEAYMVLKAKLQGDNFVNILSSEDLNTKEANYLHYFI